MEGDIGKPSGRPSRGVGPRRRSTAPSDDDDDAKGAGSGGTGGGFCAGSVVPCEEGVLEVKGRDGVGEEEALLACLRVVSVLVRHEDDAYSR